MDLALFLILAGLTIALVGYVAAFINIYRSLNGKDSNSGVEDSLRIHILSIFVVIIGGFTCAFGAVIFVFVIANRFM
jgi:hypothetical protein